MERLLSPTGTQEKKRRRTYPPSADLVRDALELNTAFLEAVIAAPRVVFKLGIGKSVYALKTLYFVYNCDWEKAKKYIVFMPQEFLALFKEAVDKDKRIPMIVWDDAGFWVGRQRWNNRFVIAVREHLNVVRTHVAAIQFTAPRLGELARGIRDQIDVVTAVTLHKQHSDPRKRISHARLYLGVQSDDFFMHQKRLPKPVAEWYYSHYFPHYKDYEKRRKQLVEIGYKKAMKELKQIADEAAEELKELAGSVEDKREPPTPDVIAENMDLEDLAEEWGYI